LLFRLVSLFCTGRKRRGGRLSVLLPESLCLFFCSAPLPASMDYFFPLFSCLLNCSTGGSLPFLHNLVFVVTYRGSLFSSLCLLCAVSCPDIGPFHMLRRCHGFIQYFDILLDVAGFDRSSHRLPSFRIWDFQIFLATTTSLPLVLEYSQVDRVSSLSPYVDVTPVSSRASSLHCCT